MLQTAFDLACGKVKSRNLLASLTKYSELSKDGALLQSIIPESIELCEQIDEKRRIGQPCKILAGIPISVKDNFNVVGYKVTAGSRMLSGYESAYDAEAVTRLRGADAIVCARANMDEFGMGSSMLNSAYGQCVSPWTRPGSPAITPGGSSGGSATLVARGVVSAAIGSDTGGSIRQPSSFCGLVGLKPTYGAISRHGLISYASSMDTVGPITKTVVDAAIMLDVLHGRDDKDPSTSISPNAPITRFTSSLLDANLDVRVPLSGEDLRILMAATKRPIGLKGMKVGVPLEFVLAGGSELITRCWQQAIEMLEDAGASVVTVSIPSLRLALPAYYVVACAEASSNLSRYDGLRFGRSKFNVSELAEASAGRLSVGQAGDINHSAIDFLADLSKHRGSLFGAEVIKRILAGSFVLSKGAHDDFYGEAAAVRASLRYELREAFGLVDLLICPTAPDLPFPMSEPPTGLSMLLHDAFTVPVNLVGCPAISVPISVVNSPINDERLPIGMQFIGAHHHESTLLRAGLALEQRSNFAQLVPKWVQWEN